MKTWFLALVSVFFVLISTIQVYPGGQRKWQIIKSPTRNKIIRVIVFPDGKAIAAANKLYLYDSSGWKEFPVQPPINGISRIFALNENHIWAAKYKLTNESDFFLYKDSKWTKIDYPLVNGIQDISLNDRNEGWYCGDREIAYFNNSKADFIPFPPNPYSSYQCYGPDRNHLWLRSTTGIYFYNGIKWTSYFADKQVKYFYFSSINSGFALIEDKLFQYTDGNWKIHSKNQLLNDITKFCIVDDEIWGIGQKGLLIKYNGEWNKVNVPVSTDLYDIGFSSNGEGFIVSDQGIILKYSSQQEEQFVPQPGFDRLKIFNVAKDLTGEYGVVMEDFNNDGYKDIYSTCIFEPNRMYINQMDKGFGTFTEEAIKRNITGRIGGNVKLFSFSELYLGAGSADIDNDGDQDLYLCDLVNENKLFENDGKGNFRNISSQNNRATDKADRTNSAVFSDIDNDGDLDLFLSNEYSTNRLYENNGYGYFKEITESAGLTTSFGGMGSVFADIDNDNYPDLYVVNWARPNILYKNVTYEAGNIKFQEITERAGVSGGEIKKSNAAVFFDYDNDGDPDLYVTNRRLSNRLFRNDGNCIFKDVTEEVIGLDSLYSYGASFADFDNDGYGDLYVANVGENKMFKNLNGERFVDVTASWGVELSGYSTGTASGDIDNDGDIDLYVANYFDDNSMLFINNLHNNNFICVNVVGFKSNRDAVGTKLWLYKAGHSRDKRYILGYRQISGGSGYSSKDSREVHFGVKEGGYDLVVYFPASKITRRYYNVTNGQKITVNELEGVQAQVWTSYRWLSIFVFNHENQTEVLKFSLIIAILIGSYIIGKKRYDWRSNFYLLMCLPVMLLYIIQIVLLRYETILYSTIVPFASVIFLLWAIHMFFEHSIMREKVIMEKEKTRDSFARDLHDDLASTISSALIYADMLSSPELPEKAQSLITKISSLLKEAAAVVTDIIWAVSPRHDNIEDLITRLEMMINDLCRVNSIEFHSEFNFTENNLKIPDESRRNIYLIFKEGINNTIKHASATKVNFCVEVQGDMLIFSLYDNGIGFDPLSDFNNGRDVRGNGLRNIKIRASEIGAELQIRSSALQGTYINLKQKIA